MRPTPAPTCSRVDGGSWTSGQGASLESAGRQPRRADTASEYDQPTLSTFECISRSLSDRMRTFPYAWPVVYPARKRDEKSSRMFGVSPMWTTSGREVRDTFLPGEEAPHGEGRIDGEGGSGDSATHPPAVFGRSELRNTLKSFIPRKLLSVLSPCFPRRFPHCKRESTAPSEPSTDRTASQLAHRPPPFSASNSRRTSSSEMSADQPYAAATAASRASCASASHCGRAL